MAAIDPQGDQKYWINGETFQGVRFQPSNTGDEKFWLDGLFEENIFPANNKDTGKFFLVFE